MASLRYVMGHGTGDEIVAAWKVRAREALERVSHDAGQAACLARQELYVEFRDAATARGEFEWNTPTVYRPFGYEPTDAERQAMKAAAEAAVEKTWE